MPKLEDHEVDALLAELGHLVRIGTVDDDGTPRVVPTWFLHLDGRVLFTPRERSAFYANLQRDPRVGLSIDEEALPYRKVSVQGRVEVVHPPGEDDAWRDTYRQIAERYIPADEAAAYIAGTVDQPRALLAVDLAASRVTTWRMPVAGERPTGIWARRYYGAGTLMDRAAAEGS